MIFLNSRVPFSSVRPKLTSEESLGSNSMIVAPGSTAPVESTTVPLMENRPEVWAWAARHSKASSRESRFFFKAKRAGVR